MGFGRFIGDLLSGKTNCPLCGTPGSTKEGDRVRCLNPQCANFFLTPGQVPAEPRAPKPASQSPQSAPQAPASGPGLGSARTITIQYKNFQDQHKTFTADVGSLRRKKNHIVARVAPSGKILSLSRDRIQNMTEVDQCLPAYMRTGAPYPTAKERQVLGYHKKHKSTSPLYEKIRAKFPDW
ncbi:MAG: hypothetical protein LAP21_21945 [Acidobacteriia bacterium]|nr:hypothetical protein [Terriglobia bacterium]